MPLAERKSSRLKTAIRLDLAMGELKARHSRGACGSWEENVKKTKRVQTKEREKERTKGQAERVSIAKIVGL